jgi:hypothetical protein
MHAREFVEREKFGYNPSSIVRVFLRKAINPGQK